MKLIIAGGRDFSDYEKLRHYLNNLTTLSNIEEIVSGGAKGADFLGETYALEYGLPVKKFPADWSLGKKAGYLRNKQMAEYATHCICFWDGESKGTKLMIDLAKEHKLKTIVIKY